MNTLVNLPTFQPSPYETAVAAYLENPSIGSQQPAKVAPRARNGQPKPLAFTGRLPGFFVARYGPHGSVLSCASIILGYANIKRHRARDRGYHRMSFRGLGREHAFDRKTFAIAAKLLRIHHLLDLRIFRGRFGGIFFRHPRFRMDLNATRKITAWPGMKQAHQDIASEIRKTADAEPTRYAKIDENMTLR